MHGPEEAVATSWFKERAKGVVTSLQSVCWVFHHCHLRQALPTGSPHKRGSFLRSCVTSLVSSTLFSPLRKACHQHLGKDYLSDVCVQTTPTSLITFCVLQSMALKGNLKCNGLYVNMRAAGGAAVCVFCPVLLHVCPTTSVGTYFHNVLLNGKKIKMYNRRYRVIFFSGKRACFDVHGKKM